MRVGSVKLGIYTSKKGCFRMEVDSGLFTSGSNEVAYFKQRSPCLLVDNC